jgi:hypothetical protein
LELIKLARIVRQPGAENKLSVTVRGFTQIGNAGKILLLPVVGSAILDESRI